MATGRRPGRGLLLVFIAAAANVILWTEFLLYSQNTLLRSGRWISTKRMMGVGLSSDSFLLTRAPLHRNRLDLGAYQGHNEVVWRRPFAPDTLGFSFLIPAGSELNVLFNKTADGFSGLRLSADPSHPGLFFHADPDARFTSARELPLALRPGRWHRLELRFAAGRLDILMDGGKAASLAEPAREGQLFGFRGGGKAALVDDIVIRDASGRTERESFRNREARRGVLARHAAAAVLILALGFALGRLRGLPSRESALRLSAAGILCAVVGALLFLFDFWYWSRLPLDPLSRPLAEERQPAAVETVEAARHALFSGWHSLAGGRRMGHDDFFSQGYPAQRVWAGPVFCGRDPARPPEPLGAAELAALLARRKTSYRILFAGSSQTIGAGARELSETFFARIHRSLAAARGPAFPIESLNTAVSGSDVTESFREYARVYERFRPDLVAINFSLNGTPGQLRRGLADYVQRVRARGSAVVLLREAKAPGSSQAKAERMRAVVDSVGRDLRVPVLDLHGRLSSPELAAAGFLWWDPAHLTPFGQAEAARWLTARLLPLVRRPAPR